MAYDFCEISAVEGKLCAITAGFSRFNIGGMNEAIFFPESYVLEVPAYSYAFDANKSAQVSGNIVLRAGATGYRFRFTPETGSFTEPMQETDAGVYFDQLFNISIPKDRPEITWLKFRMAKARYALLYRDANGITKLLRNLRVKLDLNTGRKPEEYNGHVLYARKAAISPAIHWNIASSTALETIFTVSTIALDSYYVSYTEGWQAGKKIELPNTPISADSIMAIYNNTIHLRLGSDFTLSGKTVTLNFSDVPDAGGPGDLLFLYAANLIADDLSGFVQHLASKTSSYTSGETITLPSAPADADHLFITMNSAVALRPGTDYSLAGDTVTLLFAGTPSGGDPDTFHIFYATSGTAIDIENWKNFRYDIPVSLPSGSTFNLPHVPIANSVLLWLDGNILLQPGVDFNITNDEIELLFDTADNAAIDCWYAY